MKNKSAIFSVLVCILCGVLLGILPGPINSAPVQEWNRLYAYTDNQIKFVKIDTNIGPTYVNVAHIVSIRKTNAVGQEGKTEIALINGTEFYSSEHLDQVVSRIIEK